MIDQDKFIKCLQDNGVQFITGVPDTLLNDFCLAVEKNWPADKHIIAANEGNAIGLASGYHISTKSVPLVYMQNSGLGNCVNPLLSLTHKSVYSMPLILLIGWRGDPDKNDHPQHKKQGELTPVLLDDMDIPYRILEDDEEKVLDGTNWAVKTAMKNSQPVALIARKGVFEKGEKDGFPKDRNYFLTREEAIEIVLNLLPEETIYVASTGRATRELHAIREAGKMTHEFDFLNVGAMGHTSSIAQGISVAKKDNLVVCLEGDASAIMHLGAFSIIGKEKPNNLLHIVLNNGVHESVGGQLSAGFITNLSAIAKNAGYNTIDKFVKSKDEIEASINKLINNQEKPGFLEIRIQKGIRKDLPPLKFNHIEHKNALIKNLTSKS